MDPEKNDGEQKPIVLLSQQALQRGKFELDADAGTFKNVSIITRGPAIGHGFDIDDVMIRQVRDILKKKVKGVKSRMTHPEGGGWFGPFVDGIEMLVGRAGMEAHIDNGQVRGNVQLGKYAKDTPKGNLWNYLTGIADEDPEVIGLSIVFVPDEFEERRDENNQSLPPAGRVKDVLAVDFVGDPGANPAGLLSAAQGGEGDKTSQKTSAPGHGCSGQASLERTGAEYAEGARAMNEKVRKYLESVGLAKDADEAGALKFLKGLEGVQKEIAEALGSKDTTKGTKEEPAKKEEPVEPVDLQKQIADHVTAERAKERERMQMLSGLAETYSLGDAWVREQFTAGTEEPDAYKLALKKLAEDRAPIAGITGGEDRNLSSLKDGISDAILLRANRPLMEFDALTNLAIRGEDGRPKMRQPHDRSSSFRFLTLLEICRGFLGAVGVPGVQSISRSRVAELALNPRILRDAYGGVISLASTSDFPFILEDAMGKSLRSAYTETPSTWQIWVRKVTAPDFKDIKRVALSEAPDLTERDEGAPVTYATLTETRETYALVEYAKGIILTRRAIINDDLDAFSRIPVLQGNAARRNEDDVAYAILTANAALADSVALFSVATHANMAGTAAAPSVASLNAGQGSMRIQTGIGGDAILNLTPKFLVAPAALEGTVKELLTSQVNPAATAVNVVNIWQGGLTPVIEPRLDANSTIMWYLACDYNQIDTIELAFLEDEQAPVLKTKTEFDTDDVKFAVRHTCAAKAIDHRGLYANTGA